MFIDSAVQKTIFFVWNRIVFLNLLLILDSAADQIRQTKKRNTGHRYKYVLGNSSRWPAHLEIGNLALGPLQTRHVKSAKITFL